MSRETQTIEARKRLERTHVMHDVISAFDRGYVWKSDISRIGAMTVGALFELNDDEKRLVSDFEEEWGSVVYHVIHGKANIGEYYAMLYVSPHEEEWPMDHSDLKEGMAVAYVYNKDMPDCSEIGSIGFKEAGGGLVRTW